MLELCTLISDDMKIKEAIDRTVRSRHFSIVMECLKNKDGLTYKELYVEYCKLCEKENTKPVVYVTMYTQVRNGILMGLLRKENFATPGKQGMTKKIWLVKWRVLYVMKGERASMFYVIIKCYNVLLTKGNVYI